MSTNFEYAWTACPAGSAMIPGRCLRFDRVAGLVHGPLVYDYVPATIKGALPSTDWVYNALGEFVRGEFGHGSPVSDPPFPGTPQMGDSYVSREFPHHYLEECERTLVYGPYLANLADNHDSDLAESIYRIISDPLLGNKANARNIDFHRFREQVEPHLRAANRLRFAMPAYPFKDQNPFRTESGPGCVDMGELALMIRLHVIALALYQVHPHGADFILVSDGRTYADIFGVERVDVEIYQRNLLQWRNELNLECTISIVDLGDLVARCDNSSSRPGGFSRVKAAIRGILESLESESLAQRKDGNEPTSLETFSRSLTILQRGMMWNLNLRGYLSRLSPERLWMLVRGNSKIDGLSRTEKRVAEDIRERSREAALEYASFNLALKYLDMFSVFLPATLRATVHPKPHQISVPTIGKVFPWNGVAICVDNELSVRSIEVMPITDAARKHGQLVRCRFPGSQDPLMYSVL